VGVIGLTSIFKHQGLMIDPPEDALYSIIDEVDARSDIVVLLFHAEDTDFQKMKNQSIPLDLVIQSKSRRRSNDGGESLLPVFTCGDRGKYLYQFDFEIVHDGARMVDLSSQKKIISTLDRRLVNLKRNNLNMSDTDSPEVQKVLNEISEINRQKFQANKAIESAQNSISFERFELGKNVVHRPDVLKIIDDGKAMITEKTGLKTATPYNSGKSKAVKPATKREDLQPAVPFTTDPGKKNQGKN